MAFNHFEIFGHLLEAKMRAIAFSIMVLSGAIMAAAGTIAESLPSARRFSVIDEWGIGIAVAGVVMLLAELFNWRPFTLSATEPRIESQAGA